MRTSMEVMIMELGTRKRILGFCAVINMTVGNTLFKKRTSHLVTYESCPLKSQVDYCLVRRNQRQFGGECITQHKPLECDFKIWKVKDTRRKFVPMKKIWKIHEDCVKIDFTSYNIHRASNQKDASVEGFWNTLKKALLETTNRSCEWTKRPARHKETW